MDGLRFYAALLVFMTHCLGTIRTALLSYPPVPAVDAGLISRSLYFFADGNHGVDIFFVLSGYLMGVKFFGSRGNFSYGRFIQGRFSRIYPAFLASYLVVMVCNMHFGWAWSFNSFIAGLFFLNAVPALDVIPYHYVSWSIGFEFLFYLVFPALLFLPARFSSFTKATIAVVIVYAVTFSVPELTWLLRMTGLFLGLWIASLDRNMLQKIADRVPLWVGLAVYAAYLLSRGSLPYPVAYSLMLPGIALIFISSVFGSNWLNRLFSTEPLRFLGTISYSFYLWHTMGISIGTFILLPFFGVPRTDTALTIALMLPLTFCLSVLMAFVSFKLFEASYFRKRLQIALPLSPEAAEPLALRR
ncbi:acyltransferase [Aureimonas fodinaquatilis]|uniref:Acyltransferase n=1 Tax=Aureimonas fodinaquatilis TaxID=2565783 RepID=A0A5B0DSQ0_9HYPH|nr:acyltransferase [Aureimonas fodinaquatilis]KAA0969015.1 acyltransferase [Aureimonas fodinaquatilis]